MVVFIPVECPKCGDSKSIVKFGQTSNGKQRFQCQSEFCDINTFIMNHERKGWLPETKAKIIEMTLNGSGIRDISRVLGICTETVSSEIKKERILQSVNYKVLEQYKRSLPTIKLIKFDEV